MAIRVKYLGYQDEVLETVGKYQLVDLTAAEYEQERKKPQGSTYWLVINPEAQKADEEKLGAESLGPQATPDPEWNIYSPSHFVDKNGNSFRHW